MEIILDFNYTFSFKNVQKEIRALSGGAKESVNVLGWCVQTTQVNRTVLKSFLLERDLKLIEYENLGA